MADPPITTLLIRDEASATQNAATVAQGGNLFPAHAIYGWDGSTALHPVLVDSSGRPIVSGAAAAGAAIAGNPVLMGGSDGANARAFLLDASGRPILGPSSQIVGKVGIDQTTPGTTNAVSVTNAPTTWDVNAGAAGTSTQRVVLATGGAALPAGAALIGKVGIDQTTPGTTNAVHDTSNPTAWDTGAGAAGASTQRFVLATGGASQAVSNLPTTADTNAGAAGASTIRVVVATGGSALPAGAALIGKVGIDQTTPGTTNAVQATNFPAAVDTNAGAAGASTPRVVLATNSVPFTRYLTVRGHFSPLASASYSGGAGTCVGGQITVATGLAAGTPVLVDTLDWIVQHATSVATGLGVVASLFNAALTGTWTDGSLVVWSVADVEQRVDSINLAGAAQANASIGSLAAANRARLTVVDGSGNLYLGLYASAAPTYVGTPTAAWTVQLRY